MFVRLALTGALVAFMAGGAAGMVINSSGTITDWGITPFSLSNQSSAASGNLWMTIQNNTAPINYPGVGYQPSPGLSAGGEAFDLEEMYMRINSDNKLQVLVVTSSNLQKQWGGDTVFLGDLILSVGGQQFGVVTQTANAGLAAGSVYRLNGPDDAAGLQPVASSYYGHTTLVENDYGPNATVDDIIGTCFVKQGSLLGMAALEIASYNYGGAEDFTTLIVYTFDPALLGLGSLNGITAQTAWGCGNDVIQVSAPQLLIVPEPASIALLATGLAAWLATKRRRPQTH